MSFFSNFFTKIGLTDYRKEVIDYENMLLALAATHPDDLLTKVTNFPVENKLSITEKNYAQENACKKVWDSLMSDGLLKDQEYANFRSLINVCDQLSPDREELWTQKALYRNSLYSIQEKHELPVFNKDLLDINYKKDELLHFAGEGATYIKQKRVTKRINYSGPVASFKICKGLRYRVGSINLGTETSKYMEAVDTGIFFITSQRLGFIGAEKSFTVSLNKILSCEMSADGLMIRKEGRETPYILNVGKQYDLPCAMISQLLNSDDE